MIFNDVADYYNEITKKGEYIITFKEEIINIKKQYIKLSKYLIEANLNKSINGSNWGSYRDGANSYLESIQCESKRVNLMKIGRVIAELDSIIEIDENISKPMFNMMSLLEQCCDMIFDFVNTPIQNCTPEKLCDLIGYIDSLVVKIDNVFLIADYLKTINNSMQPNCKNEESTIEIRLYRTEMTMLEINKYMETINGIYERTCNILNISTSDYKLIPVKLESGSWYEKLFGSENAMKFIKDLLNRSIGFIYRNYTREGKLSETKNKIEALKEGINLIELCKEHNIDTEVAKEILEENLNVLCADIYNLTTGNSQIAIDGRVYDVGKELSQALLEETNKKYIEEAKE